MTDIILYLFMILKKTTKKKTKHQLHCPAPLYNILNLRISTQSYVMGNQIQFITACNKNDFLFRLQGNISKDNVIFFISFPSFFLILPQNL